MQSMPTPLAEYAASMDFVACTRSVDEQIASRSFALPHSRAEPVKKAAAKNHLHALNATSETPKAVIKDAESAITQLEEAHRSLNSWGTGLDWETSRT